MRFIFSLLLTIILTNGFCTDKSNTRLALTYTITKDSLIPNGYFIHAEIQNLTSEDIYFLSESCNGLDAYLTTSHPSAQIPSYKQCFVSFPEVKSIPAGGTFQFQSPLNLTKDIQAIALSFINTKTKLGSLILVWHCILPQNQMSLIPYFMNKKRNAEPMNSPLMSNPAHQWKSC